MESWQHPFPRGSSAHLPLPAHGLRKEPGSFTKAREVSHDLPSSSGFKQELEQ